MPGARTHDLITLVSGVALAFPYYRLVAGGPSNVAAEGTAVFIAAHLISGIMFSPDLDLDSAIDNRWGIFFWIWRPYMWLVPHRSPWLSHGLVLPPLLRLAYFQLVITICLIALAWLLGLVGIVVPNYHAQLAAAIFGWMASHPDSVRSILLGFITGSAAHSIADWLVTGGKHYLRFLGVRLKHSYANHDGFTHRTRRRRSWNR